MIGHRIFVLLSTLVALALCAPKCNSPLGCDDIDDAIYSDDLDPDLIKELSTGGGPIMPMGAFPPVKTFLPTVEQLKALPECQLKCTRHFSETIQVALQAPNHYERYRQVCERYNSTSSCMAELSAETCTNKDLFGVVTSGLKYMCVDQSIAFNGTIRCIDHYASRVQMECEDRCKLKLRMTQFAMRAGLMDLFLGPRRDDVGNAVPTRLGKEEVTNIMEDACGITKCYLECIRSKFNVHCDGAAGALLTEAFVRPFADAQRSPLMSTMITVLNFMMPDQCGFITETNDLQKFRIDPKVEADVQRMMTERLGNATDPAGDADLILADGMHADADAEEAAVLKNRKKSPLDD